VLESEQQDALGATCTDGGRWAAQQCTPTCYPPEPASGRAGTRLAGVVEIEHLACQREGTSTWTVIDDELGDALAIRSYRKRPPRAHRSGTWQAEIESALPAKHVVIGNALRATEHPLTHERLQCVKVAEYTTVRAATTGVCGVPGKVTCEAAGNAAARGLNLVRYRLAEASSLHAAGNAAGCQAAALQAVATARGLPRWRQYAKLNVGEWKEGVSYKTRFDGLLGEDAIFALAAALGADAEVMHATCGGASRIHTTARQEHAFHSCP